MYRTFIAAKLKPTKVLFCLAAMIAALASSAHRCQAAGTAPNIVLILADDQGWNGSSVQMDPNIPGSKSDFYQTPRLEQLAAAGLKFSSGYASSPVCAPTRAALQSGMSPAQLQMTDLPHAVPGSTRWEQAYVDLPLTPPAPVAFDPNTLTIPRIIKQGNPAYVTAHFGKWHLEAPNGTLPQDVGYDFGEDPPLPPYTISNGARISEDPWGDDQLAQLASNFMQDRVNNDEPFFVQISPRAPHPPLSYNQETYDEYAALQPGTVHDSPGYAAMIDSLDTALGTVLDKIDQLGISDNTYVIYVSDNGAPVAFSSNAPLRIGKATVREGGIRVPFIVSGPNVEAGTVSSVPVSTTDLLPTIASLTGYTGALPGSIEGTNLQPLFENQGQLPAGTDHLSRNFASNGELYWHWPVNFGIGANSRLHPASAVRDGDFKLYIEYGENGGSDFVALYNLATDIGESHNLANSMPEKAAELRAKLDNYLEAVDASFAFDVKQDVAINWDATQPGIDATEWRSSNDLKYKGRETWTKGAGTQEPTMVATAPFQPNLANKAFHFDGNDVMRQNFIQVGDDGPRKATADPGTPDWNRSATMEFWVRTDSLSQEGVLMESGDGTGGISVTLGDADGDGVDNDLRFRVLGLVGADTGTGVLEGFSATARIDEFTNPVRDFVHLVAVFNDDPDDRYQEIYVNGALAVRVDAALGPNGSPQWDTYDMAGLGNIGGNGLGGNGGSGDLPFTGGFQGEFAKVRFYNYAISGDIVQTNYNSALRPASYGLATLAGESLAPAVRPTNVSLGLQENESLTVIQERQDILDSPLPVDAIIDSSVTLSNAAQATPGQLPAGFEFNSYLLQFDPLGEVGGNAVGAVTFVGEIVGILFDHSSLISTDALLGSIGNYGAAGDRGLDLGDQGAIGISADLHQLIFNLSVADSDMLQFRVITSSFAQADFDGNGYVDDLDLTIWKNSLGLSGAADADGDGDTDGGDFLIWQRQFTDSANGVFNSTKVPEPTGCCVCVIICLGTLCRRRFNRRRPN